MSAKIQAPLNQRRHTNVAIVRLTKNKVKLEIACYKNKVISFRAGIENRLDEVLQVFRIFTNVSKGHIASTEEIRRAFGSKDISEHEALMEILAHGELQVAQQERNVELNVTLKEIATKISQMCIHSITKRPFPPVIIEETLRTSGAVIRFGQPVKPQALAMIHHLQKNDLLPIVRAPIKVRCVLNISDEHHLEDLTNLVLSHDGFFVHSGKSGVIIDSPANPQSPISFWEKTDDEISSICVIPPTFYKDFEVYLKNLLNRGGSLRLLETAFMEEDKDNLLDYISANDEPKTSNSPHHSNIKTYNPNMALNSLSEDEDRLECVKKISELVGGKESTDKNSETSSVMVTKDCVMTNSKIKNILEEHTFEESDNDDQLRGHKLTSKEKRKKREEKKQKKIIKPINDTSLPTNRDRSSSTQSSEEIISQRKLAKKKQKNHFTSFSDNFDDDEFSYESDNDT